MSSLVDGFAAIGEALRKQQAYTENLENELDAYKKECEQLQAQVKALLSGIGVQVLIDNAPFLLAPARPVAFDAQRVINAEPDKALHEKLNGSLLIDEHTGYSALIDTGSVQAISKLNNGALNGKAS